jgi:8-oxo-dGTP diphosphatase
VSRREYPDRPWVGIGVVAVRGDSVLLVRRGKPPRLGSWSLPGGAQRLGEQAEAAARRELREETGIEVGLLDLLAVVDGISHDDEGAIRFHYTIIDYCARWLSGEVRAGGDVTEAVWAAPGDLVRYELTEAAHQVIAEARRRLAAG